MALRMRGSKDVKKRSYYVWYLGSREAKGVEAMPGAIAYLLERERLQEPFKVTLQVSSKGLKIIQTVHPGVSTKSAVKHLVPGHAVLAAVQREDIVAATFLLPNPATNNPVHVQAYRCVSVETAELLGNQLKALSAQSDSPAKVSTGENRVRSNLGSDGRSTRESESSEGSGELRHAPAQSSTIYESLAAELRAKLGRGNSADNDVGPILLPPRDYDTVHRHRGNLAGIEFRRCLNQTIVGGNTAIERGGGARSAASSGIGSDSAATPPPYQPHQALGPRPSRPSRDTSSDEDWGVTTEENEYFGDSGQPNMTLPRVPRSPEMQQAQLSRALSPSNAHRVRRAPELRQRSPSPQYQPRLEPAEVTTPRERFQDAKEMFKAMERENIVRPVAVNNRAREFDDHHVGAHRLESSRPANRSSAPSHERLMRRSNSESIDREKEIGYRARVTPRNHHYPVERALEPEISSRPRPRSFYDNSSSTRDLRDYREHRSDHRDQRNLNDVRDSRERQYSRDIREKPRARPIAYPDVQKHERYPIMDREHTRSSLEIVPTSGRYRHSYAEPPRLGIAALDPY
ncbi:uncharacterized protein [Venturia canescens]|uniref:uncharacterized protein isoform X1 n=1 Tax=Venturia canescens TaxID=32260 RepID=UPI001C9D20AA|nr:uncharacterized protein LOC122414463 isoform X1 [Venturia canescens]XP_043281679.1 uncharacterized protein LOC122414463 isoform X1 [Venturia canescens]XP_043281680.1 uncharacterized protein LOC122414463 isoform X1 [Venturia canescens]XP_043281681.1 uncharacterized protein LOC122414463 isoform X1 [Venturia canescens]XP_043281682.1 uncharacterized protein LOC122414463 isoform X1 [Venturia canescens]XP_043281683.1 uncharacterized protein LOC122414463 isoform X1 [Venturia canescens]